MDHGIRPEQKEGIGANCSPIKYGVPSPIVAARCLGWSQDGSYLRTNVGSLQSSGR